MSKVIGIDPGKCGGFAILNEDGSVLYSEKMPDDLWDFYTTITRSGYFLKFAFIEKVNAGPKMGSSAAFKFGQNVGGLRTALMCAEFVVNYVSPQKWQKEFGLITKGRGLGQDDTAKKNRNKARAQELFPGIKITHAIADALLIAEYGRRQLK